MIVFLVGFRVCGSNEDAIHATAEATAATEPAEDSKVNGPSMTATEFWQEYDAKKQ